MPFTIVQELFQVSPCLHEHWRFHEKGIPEAGQTMRPFTLTENFTMSQVKMCPANNARVIKNDVPPWAKLWPYQVCNSFVTTVMKGWKSPFWELGSTSHGWHSIGTVGTERSREKEGSWRLEGQYLHNAAPLPVKGDYCKTTGAPPPPQLISKNKVLHMVENEQKRDCQVERLAGMNSSQYHLFL